MVWRYLTLGRLSFCYRAIQAKKARQSSIEGSKGFAESRIKGGKSEAKAPVAPKKAAATENPAAAAEDEEPEEIFEVEAVEKLDESKLSTAQKDHPYAKLLGPKLVKYDKQAGKFVEIPTAQALDGKVTSIFFHAHQVM